MKPRVLYGVLNWGLGHAVRSVPVIKELLKRGAEVIICGNGNSFNLLKNEFPDLKSVEILVPEIRYSNAGFNLLSSFSTVYRIVISFFVEKKAVRHIVKEHGVTHIVSDHKYGLRTGKIPTAIICHQLKLKLPKQLRLFEKTANYLNRKLLHAYSEIWIPDLAGELNLSGDLSSTEKYNANKIKYLGVPKTLQTCKVFKTLQVSNKKWNVAVICSGPEPWRSVFERKAVSQLLTTNLIFIVIRGTTKASEIKSLNDIDMATRTEISEIISNAELVVSLAGYTSVCDYYTTSTKALLIPTPNQPEQEYLAERQKKLGYFHVSSFAQMNIPETYEKRNELNKIPDLQSDNLLEETISSFLYTAQNQSVSSLS